ncbi:MAG: hypothetical protein R3C26_14810 [Calditrichia bacterium]
MQSIQSVLVSAGTYAPLGVGAVLFTKVLFKSSLVSSLRPDHVAASLLSAFRHIDTLHGETNPIV